MYIPNICPLCYNEVESVHHIFIHCKYASEVWHEAMREAGVACVFPSTLKDLFNG